MHLRLLKKVFPAKKMVVRFTILWMCIYVPCCQTAEQNLQYLVFQIRICKKPVDTRRLKEHMWERIRKHELMGVTQIS